jgi:hypothetical protein
MRTDRAVGRAVIGRIRLAAVSLVALGLLSGVGSVLVSGVAKAAGTGVPSAPSALWAVAGGWDATLSWKAPVSTGTSPIVGYFVTVRRGSVAGVPSWFSASSTSVKILGLKNGTGYQFTVVALNAAGASRTSAWSNYVTPSTVPSVPTHVNAVAEQGKATVTWTAPAANGTAISGYEITTYMDGIAQPAKTYESTATSQVIYALASTDSYSFRVAAVNGDGVGPISASSPSVKPTALATAPGSVVAVARSGAAALSWAPPARTGNVPLTGYYVTAHDGSSSARHWFAPTVTSASVTGLTNNTGYQFTVVAVNADGNSPSSAWSNYVTPSTVPNTPTGVSATGGNGQAIVWWKVPAGTLDPITHYLITPYIAGVAQTPRVIDSTVNAQTITGLVDGTGYQFTVTAVNAIGNSVTSSLTNAVTPAADPTTFDDEFDGAASSGPNAGLTNPVWYQDPCWSSGCGNGSYTQYLAANTYQDGDGDLVLRAGTHPTPGAMCDGQTCRFSGAGIEMFNGYGSSSWSQEYGTFSARIKVPSGSGLWPAFWLAGSNRVSVGWPACGEIDALEADGGSTSLVQQHIHYGTGTIGSAIGAARQLPAGESTAGWHVYSVTWTPSGMVWDVDGTPTMVILASTVGASAYSAYFSHPFSIILDLTVGGTHTSIPNSSTPFPASMLVDYVRVTKI